MTGVKTVGMRTYLDYLRNRRKYCELKVEAGERRNESLSHESNTLPSTKH